MFSPTARPEMIIKSCFLGTTTYKILLSIITNTEILSILGTLENASDNGLVLSARYADKLLSRLKAIFNPSRKAQSIMAAKDNLLAVVSISHNDSEIEIR